MKPTIGSPGYGITAIAHVGQQITDTLYLELFAGRIRAMHAGRDDRCFLDGLGGDQFLRSMNHADGLQLTLRQHPEHIVGLVELQLARQLFEVHFAQRHTVQFLLQ